MPKFLFFHITIWYRVDTERVCFLWKIVFKMIKKIVSAKNGVIFILKNDTVFLRRFVKNLKTLVRQGLPVFFRYGKKVSSFFVKLIPFCFTSFFVMHIAQRNGKHCVFVCIYVLYIIICHIRLFLNYWIYIFYL